MEMFIGVLEKPKDKFPKSYLEINVSPFDYLFVNRIENPLGNRKEKPELFKHIVLGEKETGI